MISRRPALGRWRRTFVLLTSACLFLALSNCDERSPSGSSTPHAPPFTPVRLGYFANLTHAQAVLGVASGDFQRAVAPAKLTTQVFNAGPSLVEALFAGEIDIAYIGPGPVLTAHARSRGQSVRVIAGAAANGVRIVARPGSGIERFEDLKGKRVATPQLGNTQDISARHFLKSVLNQPDLNNVLPVPNAEQVALMARGQIDAAWVPEPWGARLVAETGARAIAEEKDLWPGQQFLLTLVVTTPKFLAQHPDIVENLLRAHRSWTRQLVLEPQRCAAELQQALRQLTGKDLPPGVLASSLAHVRFTDGLDEPALSSLQMFAQWSHELGFSAQPTNLNGLVDATLVRKLQRQTRPATSPTETPNHAND